MISADTSEVVKFSVPSEDHLPKEERTFFHTRPMSFRAMKKFAAMAENLSKPSSDGMSPTDVIKIADTVAEVLTLLISGWENYKDGITGKQVEYFRNNPRSNWDQFSHAQIMEIFNSAMEVNNLKATEVKN